MRRWIAALTLLSASVLAAPAAPVPSTITRTSRPVRLLRTWDDTVKGKGGVEYARRVDLLYDYGRGVAREEYYGADGALLGSREIKQNQPQPSREEIDEAIALIKADAALRRIVVRRAAEFEGGFILEEERGRPCGPGTRCLQIQLLTPDHSGLLRWTVVDLVKRVIAYPVYPARTVQP
jgi:hypothetical protein